MNWVRRFKMVNTRQSGSTEHFAQFVNVQISVTSNELEESPTVVLAKAVDGDDLFEQPMLFVKPNK
jgi:hypothetical protein